MAVAVQKRVIEGGIKIREIAFPLKGKTPKPTTVGELVDRIGPLYFKVQQFKETTQKEYEKLCKELEAAVGTARADEQIEVTGENYVAEFSIREMQRTIEDMNLLFKIMGKEKFLANCKMSLEVIDSELNESQRADVLKAERTGSRRKKFHKR